MSEAVLQSANNMHRTTEADRRSSGHPMLARMATRAAIAFDRPLIQGSQELVSNLRHGPSYPIDRSALESMHRANVRSKPGHHVEMPVPVARPFEPPTVGR